MPNTKPTRQRERIWIVAVDADTGMRTPAFVDVKKYRKETGLKTVLGFQTFDGCQKVCTALDKEEGKVA